MLNDLSCDDGSGPQPRLFDHPRDGPWLYYLARPQGAVLGALFNDSYIGFYGPPRTIRASVEYKF
jgi:hypothetical protein